MSKALSGFALSIAFLCASRAGAACDQPEARQFDFWLGDWDVATRGRDYGKPGGFADGGRLEIRVRGALGGCAIVEEARRLDGPGASHGYSLRFYDPEAKRWRLLLNWPEGGKASFSELTGGFRHGRGEFFRTAPSAAGGQLLLRFSFSDITADRLRWDAAAASPGWGAVDFEAPDAEVWFTAQIFEFTRRREALDSASLRGATLGGAQATCPAPGAERLGALAGRWAGERRANEAGGAGAAEWVELELSSLAGGCLLEERSSHSAGGRSREAYAVTGFESGSGGWVRYSLADDTLRLERFDGRLENTEWIVETSGGEESRARKRLRWEPSGADTLLWIEESSADGGTSWRTEASTRLQRRP